MGGGYGNIKPSDNPKPFDKNPENINRTGANRKTFGSINKKLRDKGVTTVKKSEFYDLVGKLMHMTATELKEMYEDEDNPAVIRWIIKSWNDSKSRNKMLSEYRDWMFGKAKIEIERTDDKTPKVDFEERERIKLDKLEKARAAKLIRDANKADV